MGIPSAGVPQYDRAIITSYAGYELMPARLKIKPEDCSPLGQFILVYLQKQGFSMNHLAELSGIPQPRLRGACFKGTCPTPETLRKLAKAINRHHLELYTLAYEGRIEDCPEDAEENTLNGLVRELLEASREMHLASPREKPSKESIRKALLQLGFREKNARSA